MSALLLVVYRPVGNPLAVRVLSRRRDSASLAITRNDNTAGQSNLAAFLCRQGQRVAVNYPVRAHV